MKAEVLSIGDELLIGQVINSNAAWIGEQLARIGISVGRMTTVGDTLDDILQAFERARSECAVVIVTGGLGPTHDDRTREAVLRCFNTGLRLDEDALTDIERFFAERKRPLSDRNRDQAMVPALARTLRNMRGTAPGYHISDDRGQFFVLPGVPTEMKGMMERDILPLLASVAPTPRAVSTLLSTGIPESTLADTLEGIDTLLPDTAVAFLPSLHGVRLRLTATRDTSDAARHAVDTLADFVLTRVGEHVYGRDNESMEQVLVALLRAQGKLLAVAESCTGGLITDRLTNVPGSSDCLERGVVAYSNRCKSDMLGVPPLLIAEHGAVSREVAEAMAEGVRLRAGTDIGISTTGVAGPSGGSDEKPVGLVWIGISSPEGTEARAFHFGTDRLTVKARAAQAALDAVRRLLLHLPLFSTQ